MEANCRNDKLDTVRVSAWTGMIWKVHHTGARKMKADDVAELVTWM
jgi:hypothetical protein